MKLSLSSAQIRTIHAKIQKLALDTGKTSMQTLTLFLLERAAVRIVSDPLLQQSLVFKGGYVAHRVYRSPRFTHDIDAIICNLANNVAVERIKAALSSDVGDGAWFYFEEEKRLQTQVEGGGISLVFRSGLGEPPSNLLKALKVSIDLGVGDPVTPGPTLAHSPHSVGQGTLTWRVYTIESMLAEKLHASITLGSRNSRSKDIFDVDFFWPQANLAVLVTALAATFEHRVTPLPHSFVEALKDIDTTVLRRGWQAAVAEIPNPPVFEETFKSVIANLQNLDVFITKPIN
ncbi:MAG: nucleotidyl transferase AbiEii/AbiGii toxin family protein [Proteobacteria bacterium]|nr:MAG: nucleotidyl transferase AbiEii/AbiGii toxin family protein [Pseudomonadota bacterium]